MAKVETRNRQKAFRRGQWSERIAAIYLRLKGYKILACNYRTKSGEIDIIARKGDLIAVIEVKARPDVMASVDAVSHQSQRRIQSAASYWLASRKDAGRLSLRFDIIAVRPFALPVHLENAF